MPRLRTAVIGVGHLGKEHARILAGMPGVELVGVVDANAEQARAVAERCDCTPFSSYEPLLGDVIDAAVVAVPTVYHFAVGQDLLKRGISVLIEKPLAPTLAEAEALAELATQNGATLQVGHIERFNPAFEELRRRPLQARYIESERAGPFTGRSTDIGVVLDLMIHDLDLLLELVPAPVRTVEAVGISVLGGHEDIANARLTFANGCIASLSAGRVCPHPVRRMRVLGPEGYVNLDFAHKQVTFVQPAEQLRQPTFDVRKLPASTRSLVKDELFGTFLQMLQLDCTSGSDALTRELQDFVRCVRTKSEPRVTGASACRAIALADRILTCINNHEWNGITGGPTGPNDLPKPLGSLFQTMSQRAAA